jgi:hypothetical protein
MFKIKVVSVLFLAILLPAHSFASTFFFPATSPVYATGDAPKWLRNGHGKDGYVTITSEVIPASSCVPLSNHSFWGGEKTQLVLSITTNGFRRNLDNNEIPIATFDGRDNGSECASLSTLPINVVPLALLGNFSAFNPGELSLVLNVKSSSDSNQDFIGSAKLLLGAAAMVVTGGTASAVGGIAATVSNPVLSEAQTRTNNLLNGMVNAKSRISLSWPRLRGGIRTIEIPVYRADSSLGSTVEKQILQLQTANESGKTVLFTVRLSFTYTNTLFDPATAGAGELPNPDSISTSNVLNYQMLNSSYNFLQILNDASPSLMQSVSAAKGRDLSNACSTGFDKLKKIGLSNIDMALVMKSFIDESKRGPDWYNNPALVNSCFGQEPGVQAYLEKIYGTSAPEFVIGDIQDGVGKSYRDWRKIIGPALSGFRKALLAKEDHANVLIGFNGKQDIKVSFSPEVQAWQGSSDADTARTDSYPGIEKLAGKNIRTIGCFIYKDTENLNANSPGAYYILEDLNENFWLNAVKLSSAGTGKILSLDVSELTPDWQKYFESYSYPGGECAGILSRFKNQINLGSLARLAQPDGSGKAP